MRALTYLAAPGHGDPAEQVSAIARAILAPCHVSMEKFDSLGEYSLGDCEAEVIYERHKPRRGAIGVYRCDVRHLGDTIAFGTDVRGAANYMLGAYRAQLRARDEIGAVLA